MEEEDRRLGSREGRGEGNVVWGWVEEQGEWLEEEGTSDSWRLGYGGIQVDWDVGGYRLIGMWGDTG